MLDFHTFFWFMAEDSNFSTGGTFVQWKILNLESNRIYVITSIFSTSFKWLIFLLYAFLKTNIDFHIWTGMTYCSFGWHAW